MSWIVQRQRSLKEGSRGFPENRFMIGSSPNRIGKKYFLLFIGLCLLTPIAAHAQQSRVAHDDLFSVSFPTEKEGWACGRYGTILHTSDGGATWSSQSSGTTFTLSGICFSDTKNGWAVGNKGTIVHTNDGGRNWQKQESPIDYFHMDVISINPQKGFITSERTNILATTDGGKTWEVRFEDEDYILKSISFCDEQNGWAVGEFGHTYHTDDGGETWEKQAGYYEMDWDTGFIRGDDFLFDVVAIDPKSAWAVGILGTVKRTSDGGETWAKVSLDLPKVQLYSIASDGAGMIAIGGNGLCVVSPDAGVTWQPAKFEPTIEYGWIYKVEDLAPGQFVACGDEGVVYRKQPSGGRWQRVDY
jgi:photosystem II stability/assembly factor-like uncharacterized protein